MPDLTDEELSHAEAAGRIGDGIVDGVVLEAFCRREPEWAANRLRLERKWLLSLALEVKRLRELERHYGDSSLDAEVKRLREEVSALRATAEWRKGSR